MRELLPDGSRTVERVLSTETDKPLVDYGHNGEWGDRSANALQALQTAIRRRF